MCGVYWGVFLFGEGGWVLSSFGSKNVLLTMERNPDATGKNPLVEENEGYYQTTELTRKGLRLRPKKP